MAMNRRQFGLTALAAASTPQLLWVPATASAQAPAFPNKPVTIVVGFPAGGPTDIYCRALADGLSALWKQPVIVENKAGASGSLSALQVLRSPADGYTLLFTNNATNGAYEQLNTKFTGYRTLTDFAPVALFGVVPTMLVVRANLPVRNMAEFVAYAKANPGVTYGSSAIGSAPHLASELLADSTGIKMTHVPYKGAAPLMQDLLGGQIDMYIGGPSTVMDHVKSGRIKALAALHPTRLQAAPAVPTLAEQGIKGAEYASWFGLLAQAAAPAAVLDGINADARKVMDSPQMKEKLVSFGVEYSSSDRQQFWKVVQEEITRAGKVIRERKITAE
jgi:tripartite-type tricarboxylate transporter receptor subunit TctC